MLRKLLYLYNDGHNPFPNMKGKGGLGYHLPQYELKGKGINRYYTNDGDFLFEEDDGQSDDEVREWDEDGEEYDVTGRVIYDEDGDIKQILKLKDDYENDPDIYEEDHDYDADEIHKLEKQHKQERPYTDIYQQIEDDEKISQSDIDISPIENYIKNWRNAGDNKIQMTKDLNRMYNLTDDQKKAIDLFKKNNKKYDSWISSQTFEKVEIEEEPESFEPELNDILDKNIIAVIKSEPLLSDENINDKNSELLYVFNDYHSSDNPFIEYMGSDEYESLNKTYDDGFVENLLYDNSGNYPAGKDFEEKVLANIDLVKSILISTYGSERLDLKDLKINYEAAGETGDLFTVFDAHAVTFKLDGKPKESFIDKVF